MRRGIKKKYIRKADRERAKEVRLEKLRKAKEEQHPLLTVSDHTLIRDSVFISNLDQATYLGAYIKGNDSDTMKEIMQKRVWLPIHLYLIATPKALGFRVENDRAHYHLSLSHTLNNNGRLKLKPHRLFTSALLSIKRKYQSIVWNSKDRRLTVRLPYTIGELVEVDWNIETLERKHITTITELIGKALDDFLHKVETVRTIEELVQAFLLGKEVRQVDGKGHITKGCKSLFLQPLKGKEFEIMRRVEVWRSGSKAEGTMGRWHPIIMVRSGQWPLDIREQRRIMSFIPLQQGEVEIEPTLTPTSVDLMLTGDKIRKG